MNSGYIDKFIDSLSKSKFRGSFHLNKKMKEYVISNGLDIIKKHAYDIIIKRIKIKPVNDGKQTPMRQVHPVFIAQHACGFCCRCCMERIHKIPQNKELTDDEINYVVNFMIRWIEKELRYEK